MLAEDDRGVLAEGDRGVLVECDRGVLAKVIEVCLLKPLQEEQRSCIVC